MSPQATGERKTRSDAGFFVCADRRETVSYTHLYEVLAWAKQPDGVPLPPLHGHLVSPKLEVSGATLEGVEVVLDDERIGKEE